ncbi:hypothetical protein [Nocardia carnea]|uniref:hypothetical protein n=1 Tax=Nocardia carnea TaxID=37328 RepID=UPI002453882F|nr:hypothetical protein [Nocardia carnea]
MRLIDPETNKAGRGRKLSKRPPSHPAAVPIFDTTHRTDKLVFDLDSKTHGPAAVARDAALLRGWLDECGGRWISDHNLDNGGRHVIVALAAGETFRLVNIEPLLRLLAARLPTLDLDPMLNDHTGAITPPGSATRQGGYRQLDGSIADAVEALQVRSQPRLIARMRALLGDTIHPYATTPATNQKQPGHIAGVDTSDLWEGDGSQARLRPYWKLTTAIPAVPYAFAVRGDLPHDGRYSSPSEARQSVLAAAALRGMCLDDIRERMLDTSSTAWTGLTHSYTTKYEDRASQRLTQDWTNACRWASEHIQVLRSPGHKTSRQHTPPGRDLRRKSAKRASNDVYVRWLASATAWTHATWPGQSYRWTVLAVLQALVHAAKLKGIKGADGTPLVEAGVRSLSLFAGLMPVTTLADVLAHIRDLPGSPIHRVRRAAGILADQYSLVPARRYDDIDIAITPTDSERVRVEPVHDAWRVLGLHKRLIYELVAEAGLTRPLDIFAAAHIGTRAGYDVLASLKQAGLLQTGRGSVTLGSTTLDDIAFHHGLHYERAERVAHYKAERQEWRRWLDIRHGLLPDPSAGQDTTPPAAPWDTDPVLNEAIWAIQLATGPPKPATPLPEDHHLDASRDDDLVALALLCDELGGTVLTA